MTSATIASLENLHPSLWRASQLGRGVGDYLQCGHPALAAQLPGGGWPTGSLTELLIERAGSAELELLHTSLATLKQGRIALLQTPYQPQVLALAGFDIDISRLLWLRCQRQQDALWAAEQILRNGSCSALLFWPNQIKTENLRRLHLAAQTGRSLFCVIRSWQYQHIPSPAPLRLKLSLLAQGLQIDIIKRRGALQSTAIVLPLSRSFTDSTRHPSRVHHASPHFTDIATNTVATVDSRVFTAAKFGSISSELVG